MVGVGWDVIFLADGVRVDIGVVLAYRDTRPSRSRWRSEDCAVRVRCCIIRAFHWKIPTTIASGYRSIDHNVTAGNYAVKILPAQIPAWVQFKFFRFKRKNASISNTVPEILIDPPPITDTKGR